MLVRRVNTTSRRSHPEPRGGWRVVPRRTWRLAALLAVPLVALAGTFLAADPSFHVTFDVPDVVDAGGDTPIRTEAVVILHTSGLEPGELGANEWTLFVRSTGCRTVDAELSSTVRDLLGRNFFAVIDIACECPGGFNGVISSVVMSLNEPISLPPAESPHDLLRVVLEAPPLVGGECQECALALVEEDNCGMCHRGQPVDNFIGQAGRGFVPTHDERRFEFCPTSFRRGDCNDDGDVNISDAVCALNWLFLGAPDPGCIAATNTNGDAAVDISDATFLLNHLFLGGAAPVSPYPDCGPGTFPADRESCETPPESCQ